MTDAYRTEPTVLKLEQQLRDKSEECEDLRAKATTLEEKVALLSGENVALRSNDNKNAREWWTWRLTLVIAAAVALSLIYWGYRSSMQPEAEGPCRDVSINLGSLGNVKCPYANQVMGTAVEKRAMCTCPTAPAVSK